MRGVALVTMLALSVSLVGTAQAATDTTDALSLDDQPSLEDRLAFDLLLLPEHLRDQARSQMSAELPGPSTQLDPNLDLLSARSTVLSLESFISQPTIGLSTDAGTPHTAGSSSDVYQAPGDYEPAPATSTVASIDEDDTAATETGTAPSSSDTSIEAQSASSEQPSTAGAIRDAWNDLSPAEKTAVGAGIAGLLLLGPLTMYSRIKRDDALENDTRREVYEIVETNPGICIKDVAGQADVSYSTASYHLDRLVRMDYLARREEGNKVLYYKNGGTFTRDEQELVPILKNEEAMRVFQHILENPWCYRAEVAEALGVSHTTINWHLKRLAEADLVEEHREGRSCHLHIPDDALDRVVGVLDKLEEMGVEEDYAQVAGPVPA